MELKIINADADGVGEVLVRSKTVMSHYLDDPEMTAETIRDGWLITGDLGRVDRDGHLQLLGRKKNMIVTEEGKNIYPEDVETIFDGLPVKEFSVFAANFLWPARTMVGEKLVLVVHSEPGASVTNDLVAEIAERNRRLANYKRIMRLSCVGSRLPANGVSENQTRRARRTDSRISRPLGNGGVVTGTRRIRGLDCIR